MIHRLSCAFAVAALAASVVHAEDADHNRLDWLTGCWQGEDGVTREIWSPSQGGYYFGHSVVMKDDRVIFFEQMRVDPAPTRADSAPIPADPAPMPVFNAYPRGDGPFPFAAIEITDHSVTFANPDHDYPQKIKYWRDGDRLNATISIMDDSRQGQFRFTPCSAD
ncbi:MAG: DUF6265 family protein [Pseudomonadota bacterium]|nr:DUF6265 family protein [Pseudomonadota bacterium]